MDALFDKLDYYRAWTLKTTLQFAWVRKIFVARALRLLFFVSISLILNFFLAVSVPVLLLALGPIVFGVTHMFASFRFVPKTISDDIAMNTKIARTLGIAALFVGLIRIMQMQNIRIPQIAGLPNTFELLAMLVSFLLIGRALRFEKKTGALAAMLFLPIIFCSWKNPIMTASVLMIGHNFIPFIYWLKATKRPSEFKVGMFSLIMFALGHVMIFSGLMDSTSQTFATILPNLASSLDILTIAQQILPQSFDVVLLERAIAMFAFGQAVHYFIWIKVIPETTIHQQVPLSFRQSKKQLFADLGKPLVWIAVLAAFCLIFMSFFFELATLRIYCRSNGAWLCRDCWSSIYAYATI